LRIIFRLRLSSSAIASLVVPVARRRRISVSRGLKCSTTLRDPVGRDGAGDILAQESSAAGHSLDGAHHVFRFAALQITQPDAGTLKL
jgi:hypothetical protein